MSTVGLSDYLCDSWLNTLRNIPFVAGVLTFQLYSDFPGADGLSNQFGTDFRVAVTLSAGTDAAVAITGQIPYWLIDTAGTIRHIGVWDDFETNPDANFLWSFQLDTAQPVAVGDDFYQQTCNMGIKTRAT